MNVLYQDDTILVIDKLAGMPVLPDGWDKDAPYLVKLLEQLYARLWVVHRLDKVTSGVLILARTAQAHRALNMQFEAREAQKVYHAICVGAPAWDEHTARHKLRINVGHSHQTAVDNSRGKTSETHFKLLKRYEGYGLVECRPATGHTHQIRVHAYALGHPLPGDTLYSVPTSLASCASAADPFPCGQVNPKLGRSHAYDLTLLIPAMIWLTAENFKSTYWIWIAGAIIPVLTAYSPGAYLLTLLIFILSIHKAYKLLHIDSIPLQNETS